MISPGTDASGSSLPSTAHFDLARVRHRRLDDDLAIELRGELDRRVAARSACFAFEMPTLEPRLAGLTNTGKPSSRGDRAASTPRSSRRQSRAQHDVVVADRQAAGGEHDLHHRLVHADRGRQHAGADVRHVRELEQALHGAVLAVRAVQHRERRRRAPSPVTTAPVVAHGRPSSSVSPPGCATRCASRPRSPSSARRACDDFGGDGDRRRRAPAAPSGRPSRSGSRTGS